MSGIADYLNRTVNDDADAAALFIQAAKLVHRGAAILDAQKRAAELAQMTEPDAKIAADLEPVIQKAGGTVREANNYVGWLRKHGLQTCARLAQCDATLRQKYDAYCIIPPAPQ